MPNFFVIGANRAGTTSLYQYLTQHPDVFMSPVKEPNYFAPELAQPDPLWPNRATTTATLEEYEELFAGVSGEHAIGEASTRYLTSQAAPALIRDAVPNAKLVTVLRNPADRAFSDYSLHRSWGTEDLSFADAISAELDHDGPVGGRMRGYVLTGYYGRNLTRYLERFKRDRLRVYLYEDLTDDPDALLHDVFEFLGVDSRVAPDTTTRHNASPYEPKNRTVDRVARAAPVRSISRRVIPKRTWVQAREYLRRRNSTSPDFPDEVRRRLIECYRADITLTQQIIGRDLSAWLA